jgi:hypothetical protein
MKWETRVQKEIMAHSKLTSGHMEKVKETTRTVNIKLFRALRPFKPFPCEERRG